MSSGMFEKPTREEWSRIMELMTPNQLIYTRLVRFSSYKQGAHRATFRLQIWGSRPNDLGPRLDVDIDRFHLTVDWIKNWHRVRSQNIFGWEFDKPSN